MPLFSRTGRLPPALAGSLPFEPRERTLSWARCEHGCHLVATTHGLWEWPQRRPPVRHCWRTIDDVSATGAGLAVRVAGHEARCRHRVAPRSPLPDLVRAMDAGSRRLELGFTLPTGSRLRIAARSCRFEGSLVWTSFIDAHGDADPDADAATARALLRRVRAEYGVGAGTAAQPLGA
jgi:hypothetical protein